MIKDRAPKSVRIDSTTYKVGYLPADQALDVFHRLAELFLPVMRELAGPGIDADAQMFAALEQGFLRYMRGGPDTEAVVLPLLSVVTADGVTLDDTWGAHFAGRLLSFYRVLWAVIEHNFADFFAGLDDLKVIAAAMAAAGSTPRPSDDAEQPGNSRA